ncbi:hypothetical protein L8S15_11870 [Vibrio sp. S/42/10]|nr:hypothetical protein [Vibrio sp. S/42/10]MDH5879790.1 hypothetical protein [Vibrio sp. S/42/10]
MAVTSSIGLAVAVMFIFKFVGAYMGPIGIEGRYIPVMIAISVLNAFGAMFLMNIIL